MDKLLTPVDLPSVPNHFNTWPWKTELLGLGEFTSEDLPRITVVTPSYNQGQFIEETLRSVLLQDYPNLEYIVLDGGSTDNTVAILEKYSDHLTYWHSKPDLGQADAINQGIRLGTGEIFCWLNSDDLFLPGALLRVAQQLQGRTQQPHLVYGATLSLREPCDLVNFWRNFPVEPPQVEIFDAVKLTYFDYITQPSTFWTRSLWQATGELNIDYHYVLDWDWFIRAAQFTQFEPISDHFSVYRIHDSHKTHIGGGKRRQEIQQVVGQYASQYWADLYTEIDQCYSRIFEYINLWKIPARGKLLPLFFPRLVSKLKQTRDLYTVLTMYG